MKIHLIIYILLTFLPAVTLAKQPSGSIEELMSACEEARSLSQYDNLKKSSEALLKVSEDSGNMRCASYGYFYNGLSLMFLGHGDDALVSFEKAEEYADKIANDSVKALVLNSRGIYHALMQNNNFVAQQYFFKSLELAKKTDFEDLQYRVRGNLLTLSHSTGGDMQLENAREVYEYGLRNRNDEQIAMGTYYMATYYYEREDYEKTEKYLKEALDTYDKYPYEDISSVYSLYAKMLLSKQDAENAQKMVLKSIELAQKYNQASMGVEALITYAEVLNRQNRYQESIDTLKHAMSHASEIGMTNKLIDCNQLLAQDYLAMGRLDEAIKSLKEANTLLKSQATVSMERLSHEQEIMHDIEQKEMEAILRQEQIAAQRFTLILMSVVVVILLVLLGVIVNFYRRRQVLYKKIVLQNTRAVERQKQLQEQISALTKRKEATPAEADGAEAQDVVVEKKAFVMGDEKIDTLYAELCRLMEEERLFTEPQLTREKVAERLDTNRTYLTKVIKEKTGMSYLQFVNSYRINEAIRILSDRENINYPLKQIWSDLGFSSPSTFFKIFQQTVGITPSVYRKQFIEVNEEEGEEEEED